MTRRGGTSQVSAAAEGGRDELPMNGAVVVYVDSDAVLPAASWAAQQCRRIGATLQLMGYTGDGIGQRHAAIVTLLHRVAADLRHRVPDIRITTGLLTGAAATALIDLSAGAAMIVIADAGSEREWSEARALSWTLASHGRCPLIVWRSPASGAPSAPVVVGMDGSPVSVRALDFALLQASTLRVPLVVVMAWSDVFFDTERQIIGVITDWTTVAEGYRRLLAEQLAGAQERFPDVRIERVLTHDRPVRALLKEAATAQLLVVGSHGQGGFPGMLLGSVSRALVDYSPCPLAVVRAEAVDEAA
jgi:nucleotide-binding universal stress UspA family protein